METAKTLNYHIIREETALSLTAANSFDALGQLLWPIMPGTSGLLKDCKTFCLQLRPIDRVLLKWHVNKGLGSGLSTSG